MNDLRTTVGVLNGSADRDAGISAAPPRVRPDHDGERGSARHMSRRQSIAERARRDSSEDPDETAAATADAPSAVDVESDDDVTLLDEETRRRLVKAKLAERASRRDEVESGPNSRPSRRRDSEERPSKGEDGFPWTFQLDEDEEPEELQASTPLLSRAFRATTG